MAAVSKRLRFEILRRDNHTCRYCGAAAPHVKLQVDHVLPVALGGSDEATNLITACEACNSGKSSATPNQGVVAQVAADAAAWADAMKQAAAEIAAKDEQEATYVAEVMRVAGAYRSMPPQAPASIGGFFKSGLPIEKVIESVHIAYQANGIDNRFAYLCSVCWRLLKDQQRQAAMIYEATRERV